MLETAIDLFEKGEYDAAVESLVSIYESGHYKEEIREFLYANFIIPNEEEYKSVYLSSLNEVNTFPYDDLALDFIAVSEKKYYIYDKIQELFWGVVDFDTLHQNRNAGCDIKKDVRAVLVSNVWDVRLILENIYNTIWNSTYIICDTNVNRLFSFLKIPKIKSLFYNDVVFFENQEILYEYFIKKDNKYLPRIMLGNDEEKYYDIIEMLHKERIARKNRITDNILVSFCIPSYNRGNLAYENVTRYLQTEYDSEIEIVLSNNGSEVNTEGYDKLEKIQDCRLVYNKMDENKGFIGNLLAVMDMAKGKFIVLSSDEDFFDMSQMINFLNYLLQNENAAVIKTTGIGSNYRSLDYKVYNDIESRMLQAINYNYMTGICFNREILVNKDILNHLEIEYQNTFFELYPHVCIAFIACQFGPLVQLPLILWHCIEEEDSDSHASIYKRYCNLNSRIEQQNTCLSFVAKNLLENNRKQFFMIYADRVLKSYVLLKLANQVMGDLFVEKYLWEEICLKLHENNMALLEEYSEWYSAEEKKFLENFCEGEFFDSLRDNPQESLLSSIESERYVEKCEQLGAYYKENGTLRFFNFKTKFEQDLGGNENAKLEK